MSSQSQDVASTNRVRKRNGNDTEKLNRGQMEILCR